MAIPDQYDAFGDPQWVIEREDHDPLVMFVWPCSAGVRVTLNGGHHARLSLSAAELRALAEKLPDLVAEAEALEHRLNR